MNRTIFVGNLGAEVTENALRNLCEEVGVVRRVTIPRHHRSGGGRGFAFVEFEQPAVAAQALEALDGKALGGSQLRVSPARENGGRGGGGSGRPQRRERIGDGESGFEADRSEPWAGGVRGERGYGGSKSRGGWREVRHSQGHRRGSNGGRHGRQR
ncbi:MAG: RNA-binding protein [Thermoanaerobaculia bacterium]|nr:RNA-binding protein [Thermoanaerobaculia bacterium]